MTELMFSFFTIFFVFLLGVGVGAWAFRGR